MQGFGVEGLEQLPLNQGIQSQFTTHQREHRGVEVLSNACRSERVRFTAAGGGGGSVEGVCIRARHGEL